MSQRSTSPLKRSTVRRTLQRFWDVTRTQPLIVFLSVFSSAGYIFLPTPTLWPSSSIVSRPAP